MWLVWFVICGLKHPLVLGNLRGVEFLEFRSPRALSAGSDPVRQAQSSSFFVSRGNYDTP